MYTIDPHNITDYNRTVGQQQAFWLFGIIAAGKNSAVQSKKLAQFLYPAERAGIRPFDLIRQLASVNMLEHSLRYNKLGQYTRILRAFIESVATLPPLHKCTLEELESIHGVGPKTSRFFLLHSRAGQFVAVLDTHILRWMREELGVDTPNNTPSGKRYLELEKVFLKHCAENVLFPAELDLQIWSKYNRLNAETGVQ